jgi:hypothetical protein
MLQDEVPRSREYTCPLGKIASWEAPYVSNTYALPALVSTRAVPGRLFGGLHLYPFEKPQPFGPRRPSQDYLSRSIKKGGALAGEIAYWEKSAPERRGGAGHVLNVGTIQAAPAMLRDATLSALVSNALHHMCGRAPCARSLPALAVGVTHMRACMCVCVCACVSACVLARACVVDACACTHPAASALVPPLPTSARRGCGFGTGDRRRHRRVASRPAHCACAPAPTAAAQVSASGYDEGGTGPPAAAAPQVLVTAAAVIGKQPKRHSTQFIQRCRAGSESAPFQNPILTRGCPAGVLLGLPW